MNMKGQFTVVALIVVLMTVIAFARLYPTLNDAIQNVTKNATDPYMTSIANGIPFFILLALVLTIIFIAMPQK